MKDPTREEMLEFLKEQGLDSDDSEIAVYWFCHDYHGGQWSETYKALCLSQYKPGPLRRVVDQEGEGVLDGYKLLEEEFGC